MLILFHRLHLRTVTRRQRSSVQQQAQLYISGTHAAAYLLNTVQLRETYLGCDSQNWKEGSSQAFSIDDGQDDASSTPKNTKALPKAPAHNITQALARCLDLTCQPRMQLYLMSCPM